MNNFFNQLQSIHFDDDFIRNIKSIRNTQNLYDDLSDNPTDWEYAIKADILF